MQPSIETLPEKKLIGLRLRMSLARNQTRELWQQFMPRRREILHPADTAFYSVEVYPGPHFLENFNPVAKFDKWAAMAVSNFGFVPEGMETLTLPAGTYAVFTHRGAASEGPKTYQYIFGTWLPASSFALDDRPHLARMGDQYKNNDPGSEEELWIPVRPKSATVA